MVHLMRYLDKYILQKWRRHSQKSADVALHELSNLRIEAGKLARVLNEFLTAADNRIRRPRVGEMRFPVPHGTSWSWRPEIFRLPLQPNVLLAVEPSSGFGNHLKVFHDCPLGDVIVHQARSTEAVTLAPFAVAVEVFDFTGSFLALIVDFPPDGVKGLVHEHVLRIETQTKTEHPLTGYVRLNIEHGPNKEQFVEDIILGGENLVEFDFAHSNVNVNRIEKAWLEIIVNNPEMNMLEIKDVRISRRLRAAI